MTVPPAPDLTPTARREYVYPASVEEALDILDAHTGSARVIAGGTDVVPDIGRKKLSPDCLVDITRIPELKQIATTDGYVTIGAAVTFAELKRSTYIRERVHALASAAASVGTLAIQSVATWVGNLVQAMPAADGAIVALALEAELHVVDKDNENWVPLLSIYRGPGESTIDSTTQMITHIRFPAPDVDCGTGWRRIGRRPSLILPILNCAVKLHLTPDRQQIKRAVVALGPVSPVPYRAQEAERFLEGRKADNATFEQAAEWVQRSVHPRSSLFRASGEYRRSIVSPLIVSALAEAAQHARTPREHQGP